MNPSLIGIGKRNSPGTTASWSASLMMGTLCRPEAGGGNGRKRFRGIPANKSWWTNWSRPCGITRNRAEKWKQRTFYCGNRSGSWKKKKQSCCRIWKSCWENISKGFPVESVKRRSCTWDGIPTSDNGRRRPHLLWREAGKPASSGTQGTQVREQQIFL